MIWLLLLVPCGCGGSTTTYTPSLGPDGQGCELYPDQHDNSTIWDGKSLKGAASSFGRKKLEVGEACCASGGSTLVGWKLVRRPIPQNFVRPQRDERPYAPIYEDSFVPICR